MNLTVVTVPNGSTTVTLSTNSLFEDKIRSNTLSPLVGSNTCCVRKQFWSNNKNFAPSFELSREFHLMSGWLKPPIIKHQIQHLPCLVVHISVIPILSGCVSSAILLSSSIFETILLAFKLTHFKSECEALILLMFEEIGLCANNFFAEIVPVSSAYISTSSSS